MQSVTGFHWLALFLLLFCRICLVILLLFIFLLVFFLALLLFLVFGSLFVPMVLLGAVLLALVVAAVVAPSPSSPGGRGGLHLLHRKHVGLGVPEGGHVLQAGEVVLVLNHSVGLQSQDLLELLPNHEADAGVCVVSVPHLQQVLLHADGHGHPHHVRLCKGLPHRRQHQVLPQLAQDAGSRPSLLADLQNPAPALGERLPHGHHVLPVAEEVQVGVDVQGGRPLQVHVVPPEVFNGVKCPKVVQVRLVLVHIRVLGQLGVIPEAPSRLQGVLPRGNHHFDGTLCRGSLRGGLRVCLLVLIRFRCVRFFFLLASLLLYVLA
mmetsp:Transcript_23624/g.34357  ORF Transcript_23624/g.34357 Transcript_23624/m.34357 type:complete len:321 (+) Transcript_23624:178-1140(+)